MKMAKTDGLDDLLTKLGTGPWNYLFFATSTMVPAVLPVYLIGSEFLNPEPSFLCNIPEDNLTKPMNDEQLNLTFDPNDLDLFKNEPLKGTPRVNLHPPTKFGKDQAKDLGRWNLICDQAWVSPLFQTIYTAGCFLGAILAGVTADKFGRRWSVRVGTLLTTAVTLVLIVAPWLWLVLSARFLLGIFNTIMVCPAFMLSMEVCKPDLRPTVGILLALPYALMMIGLSGMAYLIRDWRVLQAVASFPCLLLIPLSLYVDESPRWLVVKGRLDDAVNVLYKASVRNRSKNLSLLEITFVVHNIYESQTVKVEDSHNPSKNPMDIVASSSSRSSTVSAKDTGKCQIQRQSMLGPEDGFGSWWAGPAALFRTKIMRNLTITLVIVWLLQGVVYLGLPLSSSSFSSPFLYMALMGAVEIPAYSLTAPITKRLGRKPLVTFCLISCGTLLLSILAFKKIGLQQEWIVLVIVLVSYLLVCTAYQVNFLYAPELLPTTLRPWGTAACTLSAYVGFSVPPFLTDYLADDYGWVPPAVFGACGIISGLLVLGLPETNGQSLPETVADLKKRHNGTQPSTVDYESFNGNSKGNAPISVISGAYDNKAFE